MIIEWKGHTSRVEKSERSIVGHHVWVEIPQVDFTGRTRTHWRRLRQGPTYRTVVYYCELEQARRTAQLRRESRGATAEMFESAEVCERPTEKTVDRLAPRRPKWRIA